VVRVRYFIASDCAFSRYFTNSCHGLIDIMIFEWECKGRKSFWNGKRF